MVNVALGTRSLVYAPEVRVMFATDRGMIEVTKDIISCTVARKVNSLSSFSVTLNNRNSRYTGKIGRMDRVVIFMKRITWVQVFAGYTSSVPLFDVYSSTCQISGTCTLKRLQHSWWDEGLQASAQLLTQTISASGQPDAGFGQMTIDLLTKVANWDRSKIHIQALPEKLLDLFAVSAADFDPNSPDTSAGRAKVYQILGFPGALAGNVLEAAGSSSSIPAPASGAYDLVTLGSICLTAGFPQSAIAMCIAIIMAESGGRPNAVNDKNSNGSTDRGLFQINSIHRALIDVPAVFDPLKNAQAALSISSNGTKWTPWSTYNNGAYQKFMPQAQNAAGKAKKLSGSVPSVDESAGKTSGGMVSGAIGGAAANPIASTNNGDGTVTGTLTSAAVGGGAIPKFGGNVSTEYLKSLFGKSEAEVKAQLVTIPFQGHSIQVHAKVKAVFEKVDKELTALNSGYVVREIGTFNWRPMNNGTGTSQLSWHCLTGDTKVVTPDGWVRIDELVAKGSGTVLTRDPGDPGQQRGQWVEAPFRSYGVAPVHTITLGQGLRRKTVRATAEHRWVTERQTSQYVKGSGRAGQRNEYVWRSAIKRTHELRPGDRLAVATPQAVEVSPCAEGIRHGLVYGDGWSQDGKTLIRLWGAKVALGSYFDGYPTTEKRLETGVEGVEFRGMPGTYKTLPSLDENDEYLAGWLAGYIATDGHVARDEVTLSSRDRDSLEFARVVALRLGIATHDLRWQDHSGGFKPGRQWTLSLMRNALPEWLSIRADRTVTPTVSRSRCWKVIEVSEAGPAEEVYCPTVEDTGVFVIEDWRLTGDSFGTTVDINPSTNGFAAANVGPDSTDFPAAWVQVWKNNGFGWGGDWSGGKDYMHFQWEGGGGDSSAVGSGDTSGGLSDAIGGSTSQVEQLANAVFGILFPTGPYDAMSEQLSGERALLNDKQVLTWTQSLVKAGLRSFQSAPNGDFVAWYPDYFGVFNPKATMTIRDIEIIDCHIQVNDDALATHVYSLGNSLGWGGLNLMAEMLSSPGVATVENRELMRTIISAQDAAADMQVQAERLYAKFGARPLTVNYSVIKSPGFQYFQAVTEFQKQWAKMYQTSIELAFMPEIYPGMRLHLESLDLVVYVEGVTHVASPSSGYTTNVEISAPATTKGGIPGMVLGR